MAMGNSLQAPQIIDLLMLKIYFSKTVNFDPFPWFLQSIKFSVLISLNLFVRFPTAGLQASCQFAHPHFPLCTLLFPVAGKEVASIWQVRPCMVVLQVTEWKKCLPYNSLHAGVRGIQRQKYCSDLKSQSNGLPSVKTGLPTEHGHQLMDASFVVEPWWREWAWEMFLGVNKSDHIHDPDEASRAMSHRRKGHREV